MSVFPGRFIVITRLNPASMADCHQLPFEHAPDVRRYWFVNTNLFSSTLNPCSWRGWTTNKSFTSGWLTSSRLPALVQKANLQFHGPAMDIRLDWSQCPSARYPALFRCDPVMCSARSNHSDGRQNCARPTPFIRRKPGNHHNCRNNYNQNWHPKKVVPVVIMHAEPVSNDKTDKLSPRLLSFQRKMDRPWLIHFQP